MVRRGVELMLLSVLLAAPLVAGERREGIWTSRQDLVETTMQVAGVDMQVLAEPEVAVADLLAGLPRTKAAGMPPEALAARVDARRRELFPDREIVLVISPTDLKAGLVKLVYWWNNDNDDGDYWYAQYKSSVAVLFVDDVRYGGYEIYKRTGSSSWIYDHSLDEDDAGTVASWGSRTLRGFLGEALGYSQADVVMWFFK